MTRLPLALAALLVIGLAAAAHAQNSSSTLPCFGTITVPGGVTTATITNPACKGANRVVATLNKGAIFHGQFLEFAAVFPREGDVKVNLHLTSRGNSIVAYEGFRSS